MPDAREIYESHPEDYDKLVRCEDRDRRSVGRVDEVVAVVLKDPALFEVLCDGMLVEDEVGRKLLAKLNRTPRRLPGDAQGGRRPDPRPARSRAGDSLLVGKLQSALDRRATEKSRKFWEKDLKGTAAFRGVPMEGVREAVHGWWREESLSLKPVREQKRHEGVARGEGRWRRSAKGFIR